MGGGPFLCPGADPLVLHGLDWHCGPGKDRPWGDPEASAPGKHRPALACFPPQPRGLVQGHPCCELPCPRTVNSCCPLLSDENKRPPRPPTFGEFLSEHRAERRRKGRGRPAPTKPYR